MNPLGANCNSLVLQAVNVSKESVPEKTVLRMGKNKLFLDKILTLNKYIKIVQCPSDLYWQKINQPIF